MSVTDIDLRDLFSLNVEFDRTGVVVAAMVTLDVLWFALMGTGITEPHVPMPGMMWLMKTAQIPMDAPGAMELGVFHVGTLRAVFDYIVMWGVMMWAMMYVTMTRFTRDYAAAYAGSDRGAYRAVAGFLSGYNVTWALSGVIPLAIHGLLTLVGFRGIYGFVKAAPATVIGSALVLAGLFQFTDFKLERLRDCCARVSTHDDSFVDAVLLGLDHGVSCVLTCFGYFFLVMPFVGEMNYFWMVVLAVPIIVERLPAAWGRELARGAGFVTLLAGLLVLLFQPDLGIRFVMSMGM